MKSQIQKRELQEQIQIQKKSLCLLVHHVEHILSLAVGVLLEHLVTLLDHPGREHGQRKYHLAKGFSV